MAKRVTDVGQIENLYDIQQYLKRFGTFIYTKNRIGDLHMMEEEVRTLYEAGILDIREYQKARHILRSEEIRLQKEGYSN